jgi:two-component system response regulator GlrR
MTDLLNILIVDDDTMMAQTLADIFHLKGYHPVAVHSAAEALSTLDQSNFDCVLMDIRMPDMDGVALFEEIRKRQIPVPVILMTAYAAEALIQRGLKAGVAGVLEKPLDLNRLLYLLSHLQKNMTITVVGDDPQFRQALGAILSNGGFKVREGIDLHASAASLNDPSGIILLDTGTSLEDCSEVLRSVHAHAPSLPLVLITGDGQDQAAALQYAQQFDAFACLHKPLAAPDLLHTITAIQSQRIRSLLEKP